MFDNEISKLAMLREENSLELQFSERCKNGFLIESWTYQLEGKKQYMLTMNGEVQIDTSRENCYSDFLSIGREFIKDNARILIIGGGDLMLFKFLKTYSVTLVDICSEIVDVSKRVDRIRDLNGYQQGPSTDFSIIIDDISNYLKEVRHDRGCFDYIIIDLPVFITYSGAVDRFHLSDFYSQDFFSKYLYPLLSEDGIITIQNDSDLNVDEVDKYFSSFFEADMFTDKYSMYFSCHDIRHNFLFCTKSKKIQKERQDKKISLTKLCKTDRALYEAYGLTEEIYNMYETGNIGYEEYCGILYGKILD